MGADVIVMPGVAAPQLPRGHQPQPKVIELLESFLADARAGRLQAVAVAGINSRLGASTGWTFGANLEIRAADVYLAIDMLKARIIDRMNGAPDISPPAGT